jgi:hypothetical protein
VRVGRSHRLSSRALRAVVLGAAALVAALAAAPAHAPAAASAAGGYDVGISDQQSTMFTSPLFTDLGIRQARLVVSWNVVAKRGAELRRVDAWMRRARHTRVAPLVTFHHARNCTRRKCAAPSMQAYRRAVRAFMSRYPQVDTYSPWNEANHQSQPTWHRPELAAGYYNVVRSLCAGECTIVALDVLDQRDAVRYVKAFRRLAKGSPRLWGLHNYSDTNRFRSTGTRRLLAAVPGDVWLTETGGVVKFGADFPYSPTRAARATSYMFSLADAEPRITRLYVYQWTGARRRARFDAGLIAASGTPRPAYYVLKDALAGRSEPPPPGTAPPGNAPGTAPSA